jgi:hypothetical protein
MLVCKRERARILGTRSRERRHVFVGSRSGTINQGFSSVLRQQAKVSRPPDRRALRRFAKARTGSAKNITPKRENTRSKVATWNW